MGWKKKKDSLNLGFKSILNNFLKSQWLVNEIIFCVYQQAMKKGLWLVICPVSQIASYRLDDEARGLASETNPKMTNIFQAGENLHEKNDEKKQVGMSRT